MKYSAAEMVEPALAMEALKVTVTLPFVGFGVSATPLVAGPW